MVNTSRLALQKREQGHLQTISQQQASMRDLQKIISDINTARLQIHTQFQECTLICQDLRDELVEADKESYLAYETVAKEKANTRLANRQSTERDEERESLQKSTHLEITRLQKMLTRAQERDDTQRRRIDEMRTKMHNAKETYKNQIVSLETELRKTQEKHGMVLDMLSMTEVSRREFRDLYRNSDNALKVDTMLNWELQCDVEYHQGDAKQQRAYADAVGRCNDRLNDKLLTSEQKLANALQQLEEYKGYKAKEQARSKELVEALDENAGQTLLMTDLFRVTQNETAKLKKERERVDQLASALKRSISQMVLLYHFIERYQNFVRVLRKAIEEPPNKRPGSPLEGDAKRRYST